MSNFDDVHKQNYCTYYIKYYPEFKRVFGSDKAAIIFERLEYWSEKYSSGFWKFFEPCKHPLYRQGDSWEEEIGFSRKVFTKVFSLIGVHYKSKSEFLQQDDPFQGKLYVSYWTEFMQILEERIIMIFHLLTSNMKGDHFLINSLYLPES